MIRWLSTLFRQGSRPVHLAHGSLGETAALRHLEHAGMRLLVRNYRAGHAEVDLVMQEGECLVFVEVKTRSEGSRLRPAAAVDRQKRDLLSGAALQYLREVGSPRVHLRFDIVEVILRDGHVHEVRHLPNSFTLEKGRLYVA